MKADYKRNKKALRLVILVLMFVLLMVTIKTIYCFTKEVIINREITEMQRIKISSLEFENQFLRDIKNNTITNNIIDIDTYDYIADLSDKTGLETRLLIHIKNKCLETGLDLNIVLGLIEQESFFNAQAVNYNEWNNTKDIGLFQNNTGYGQYYWDLAGLDGKYEEQKTFDPYISSTLGIYYLAYQFNYYENYGEALSAYNRGRAGLLKYQNNTGREITKYAESVLQKADKYKREN